MAAINIRLDDKLKKDFETFCASVGMNMSTAINIFATTVVKEQRIPFEISTEPFYNSHNIMRIKKAIEDLDNGKGKRREIIED